MRNSSPKMRNPPMIDRPEVSRLPLSQKTPCFHEGSQLVAEGAQFAAGPCGAGVPPARNHKNPVRQRRSATRCRRCANSHAGGCGRSAGRATDHGPLVSDNQLVKERASGLFACRLPSHPLYRAAGLESSFTNTSSDGALCLTVAARRRRFDSRRPASPARRRAGF